MKLSVIIPAHNEAGSIGETVDGVRAALRAAAIPYEIVVVDDGSGDGTLEVVGELAGDGDVRGFRSHYEGGFGHAVRAGLDHFEGDAVAIMMADASDDPRDLVLYYRVLEAGYDCAFGSRFMPGGGVVDYPRLKLTINRVVNLGIRLLIIPIEPAHAAYLETLSESFEGTTPGTAATSKRCGATVRPSCPRPRARRPTASARRTC